MPKVTRTIQFRGVFRPNAEQLKARSARLYLDILRESASPFFNPKSQPSYSFYGYMTVVRKGYVIKKVPIEFTHQEMWNADGLTELLNYERYWACRFPSGINFLKGEINPSAPDFSLADTSIFKTLRPNVDEFRFQLFKEDVIASLTYEWEPLFTCPDDPVEQDDPPPEEPPLDPPGVPPTVAFDDPSYNNDIDPPYDGGDDDGRTFDVAVDGTAGCWEIEASYAGIFIPNNTTFVYGRRADEPEFYLPSGTTQWLLRDAITERVMYTNWVTSTSTPSIVSAIWRSTCPTTPGGIPPS